MALVGVSASQRPHGGAVLQVHLGLVECEGGSGREAYVSISPVVVMLW